MNRYVVGFVFDNYDVSKVLMCLKNRTSYAGKFNGIGGKVEGEETSYSAMRRELKEETGCTPLELPYLLKHITTADKTGKEGAGETCELTYFAVRIDGSQVAQQPGETELLAWIPTATLFSHPEFFADFPDVGKLIGEAVRRVAESFIRDVNDAAGEDIIS